MKNCPICRPTSELIISAIDQIQALAQGGVAHLDVGFLRLNEMLNYGLKVGRVFVLGARPGVGKTTFALHVAHRVATGKDARGVGYLIASPHATAQELVARMILCRAGIAEREIRNCALSRARWEELAVSGRRISESGLSFAEINGNALSCLDETVETMVTENDSRLVVIDDIHCFADTAGPGAVVDELSKLARKHDVAVVALARARNHPTPASLESLIGYEQYEHSADVIAVLLRDLAGHSNRNGWQTANLTIVVNRHGPTGAIPYRFFDAAPRFEEMPFVPDEDVPQ